MFNSIELSEINILLNYMNERLVRNKENKYDKIIKICLDILNNNIEHKELKILIKKQKRNSLIEGISFFHIYFLLNYFKHEIDEINNNNDDNYFIQITKKLKLSIENFLK